MKRLKTTLLTVILTATLGGQHYGSRLPQQPVHFNLRPPLIAQASSLVPLQSIVVSELAKSRGKLTNKVYRKSDIWR